MQSHEQSGAVRRALAATAAPGITALPLATIARPTLVGGHLRCPPSKSTMPEPGT